MLYNISNNFFILFMFYTFDATEGTQNKPFKKHINNE